MNKYRVNYTSTVCGYLEVEAETKEEALDDFDNRQEDYQYENCTEFDIDHATITNEGKVKK